MTGIRQDRFGAASCGFTHADALCSLGGGISDSLVGRDGAQEARRVALGIESALIKRKRPDDTVKGALLRLERANSVLERAVPGNDPVRDGEDVFGGVVEVVRRLRKRGRSHFDRHCAEGRRSKGGPEGMLQWVVMMTRRIAGRVEQEVG